MSKTLAITYVDRASGRLRSETIYAGGFVRWLYNTLTGRVASCLLFRHAIASKLYGWWTRLPWSRCQIDTLLHRCGTDTDKYADFSSRFSSFNDFFTREIDLRQRPIAAHSSVGIAPVDGKVLALRCIQANETFQIKRHSFNLREFLGDRSLSSRFDGGSMVICRLSLADYHYFHFPDSGWPGHSRVINGALHAGGPYSLRSLLPYFAANRRVITRFLSNHFGLMLIVEIGALTVGSIVQQYRVGERVDKGDRKGHFELGGSTVVLLFQPNTIDIDFDLLANTADGLETSMKMGQSLGRAIGTHSYTDLLKEAM